MIEKKWRIEKDSMGEVRLPRGAYWGAETQRAVKNFPISGLRFPRGFLRALGMIKWAAARTNQDLDLLPPQLAKAISRAAQEVIEGKWDAHFVVDVFQTGSGTSTNMNANEVIANRANEILGGNVGDRKPVHPNDHVNLGQSSNDVIPSCIHIAAMEGMEKELLPALRRLHQELLEKARKFDTVLKIGRTHLQDATPLRLGQEFSGYASMVRHGMKRLENTRPHLAELALGGTAVGTGLNTSPQFARRVIKRIRGLTRLTFQEAENHFEAQGARDAVVELSSALKTLAVSLMKIGNDIRWMGSGPRAGIAEIILPAVQPGSSIMPGKVNPVIPEVLCQVAAQIIGNDTAITLAGASGNFELNVMMPLMAFNLLQSLTLLTNASIQFTEKCLKGLRADEAHCQELVEKSLAMVTSLSPLLGYEAAARIAREAYAQGKTIREVVLQKKLLPEDELEKLLDPWRMTQPLVKPKS
jgi:fumarate hydratase, class II